MGQTVKLLCYNTDEASTANTYALESAGFDVIVQYEEGGVPEQLWTIEYFGTEEISLLSVAENWYLWPKGNNLGCTMAEESYIWNLAVQGDGQYAIRPTNMAEKDMFGIVIDPYPLNLNAFDDNNQPNSGDVVGTRFWGGGNPNEMWSIVVQG